MGCSESKVDYKEVLQSIVHEGFLKKAVASRNAFADAHFAYSISLRNLCSVLSGYGQGESPLLFDKVENASNLSQVLDQLDSLFFKAFESAQDVSKLLEPIPLQHSSNSSDINGQSDYSARATPIINLNWSCGCLKFKNERGDDDDHLDNDESETYGVILNKVLAWGENLHEEVKASELLKIEYQEKSALLNKQKNNATTEKTVEKTEAGVRYSHAKYKVGMNSLDFTVSEINRLQEKQLFPKLLELVDAMAKMWQTMYTHHSSQLKIAVKLKKLDEILITTKGTDFQHLKTIQRLVIPLSEWHIRLRNLIMYQKQHIRAMNQWINYIPMGSKSKENASSKLQMLVREWHELLEIFPNEQVLGTIHSLKEDMKSVLVLQEDEMRIKEKHEDTAREYKRKSLEFDAWYKRLKENNANEGEERDVELIEERRVEIESLEQKLKEEEDLHQCACKNVREKSVESLKKNFPEVFRGLCEFASDCLDMYQRLRSIGDDEADGK